MNLNNYKIGTRLTVLLAVLSALLVAVGAFGLATLSKADETMHLIYSDRMVPTHQLDEINFYMIRNRLVISNTLIEPTPERIAKYTKEVETNIAGISKLWESYSKTSMSAENARLSKLFAETRREFVQKGLLPAVAALRDNNLPEARRLVLEGLSPLHDATKPHLIALLKNIQEDAASEYAASAARYQTVRNLSVVAITGGLLFAVIFGLFLVRGITRPLARAVDIAFEMTGLATKAALLQSVGIGVTNLVFTFVGLWLIDRLGRRTLLYIGSFGYIASLGLTAWAFFTQHYTIVPACIFAFIAAHAVGQGAVIWVYISEIFPNRHRAEGQSLGSFTHWLFAALLTSFFPKMVSAFPPGYVFLFFCGMMVLQLLWVKLMIIETKGVPLEQIQKRLGIH